TLPENLFAGFLTLPNFGKINTLAFWLVVLSVFLVSTIETLGSAKAIDKIDPLKRKTNLNTDISAMGISTVISGLIGGLPVITVIARSSVNINHGAKTRLSNFIHGALILLFVFLLSPYIQLVPKAALMAILVFTGYKLASPKVFKDASLKGYEQFMILTVTLISTLLTDLNKGILIGILFTVVIHLIRSHLPASLFFKYLAKPSFNLARIDDHYHLRVKGVANFTNVLKIRAILLDIPENDRIVFDFSHARLIDFSMLEFVSEWGKDYADERGGSFEVLGLDEHLTTSEHPYSIHALPQMVRKPLSKRQKDLKEFCFKNNWHFEPKINWNIDYLKTNKFFDTRPIEYAKNQIRGVFSNEVNWEITDITFDEGALMTAEVHNATMMRLCFNQDIPDFELDKEKLFNRLLDLAVKEDIDFGEEDDFGHEFSIKGENKEEIKLFFNKDMKAFLARNNMYHIESSENEMLVFRYFRVMGINEIQDLVNFGSELVSMIQKQFEIPIEMP
ncbi:MAG: hypothetical protein KJP21_02935, partial [Bacteroidia bacterium]|nr:hypothetical protein [Bacteroidia bacterium]